VEPAVGGFVDASRHLVERPAGPSEEPVNVDRIERNVNKLTTFYEEGYRCAEAFLKLNK
jgi:predicted patatin/cPLA2 family phospholipase